MKHAHFHRGPSPFMILIFGLLLFWLFGFKVFFFLPLLFLFGAFGMCGISHHDRSDEKPKRKGKPGRETYIDDDDNDVTYV